MSPLGQSRHAAIPSRCPLSAISGHAQCRAKFDLIYLTAFGATSDVTDEELPMRTMTKAQFIATILIANLAWTCGPVAAATRIEGQVRGGGEPIANSTVTRSEERRVGKE